MKLIAAGGGSAGHITPILAVCERLAAFDNKLQVIFIGSGSELEKRILATAHIPYKSISVGKYRRYNRGLVSAAMDVKTNWQNLIDMFKVNSGYRQSRRIIKEFKPDVVFIKGGFVGLPVGLASARAKIPIVLHDSDSVIGLTNKVLTRYASKIATGFPVQFYDQNLHTNMTYVGNPLRQSVMRGNKDQAIKHFNISNLKPTILVFGGSLGASAINEAIFDNLATLAARYNIIHITGKREIEKARFLSAQLNNDLQSSYRAYDFLDKSMGLAYAAAQIVISRSGANTVSELAYWKKPAVLIPYKAAANNEQFHNAQVLVKAGAARMLDQDDLHGLKLVSEIDKLIASKEDQKYLSEKIGTFARADAAEQLAKILFTAAVNKTGEGESENP